MLNVVQALVIVFLVTIMLVGDTFVYGHQSDLLDWNICIAAETR